MRITFARGCRIATPSLPVDSGVRGTVLDAKQVRVEQLGCAKQNPYQSETREHGSRVKHAGEHASDRRRDGEDGPGDKTPDREYASLQFAWRMGLPDRLRMRVQDGVHGGPEG